MHYNRGNTMLLIIDNYDSFTYNLVQAFGALDPSLEIEVVRNDKLTLDCIASMQPSHIVLSPGPCTPKEAGICNDIIPAFKGRIPILGVCLGHQCIGEQHGMTVGKAATIMHGKTSHIFHDNKGVFAGLPNPFVATRYHSLIIEKQTFNHDAFEISAWTEDEVIMGIRWIGGTPGSDSPCAPLEGVQFHPESFLTTDGPSLLAQFLQYQPTMKM